MRTATLAIALLPLVGCGGGGHSSSGDGSSAAKHSGTYASGKVGNDEHGTLALTVASDGTVTGTVIDSISGSGTLGASSSLAQDGTAAFTFAFSTNGSASLVDSFHGTLTQNGTTLTGTLNETQGDFVVPFAFTLTRVSSD